MINSRWSWLRWLPVFFILAWWFYDLQFQWRVLIEYQYGWMVVLLAGFLVWERWPTRPLQVRPAPAWACLSMALAGAPFILVAEIYKQSVARSLASSFALSLGCALFLAALLAYLGGWTTLRHFLFPLLFLFVAVPLPGILWNPVVLSLQNVITLLNVELLNLMGIPAQQHANTIHLPRCVVGVDEACSGVRSLQSSIMAALFIGDLTLRRKGSRLLLLAGGIALALVGNLIRSFYLSLTAHRHGLKALEGVHDAAGWGILAFTALGVIVLAWAIGKVDQWAEKEVLSAWEHKEPLPVAESKHVS